MANQKMAKELRTKVLETVAGTEIEGAEFLGFSTEGAVFGMGVDIVVVRAIVKAEGFDYEDAIAEYTEKLEKLEKARLEKEKKAK